MKISRRKKLVDSLRDDEYRHEFVDQRITVGVASQIREMRRGRGWTQSELAKESGTRQQVISQIENPDYGKLTLSTLKRIASAFDVALIVKFAPFSELIDDFINRTPESLAVPSFGNDTKLKEETITDSLAIFREVLFAQPRTPLTSEYILTNTFSAPETSFDKTRNGKPIRKTSTTETRKRNALIFDETPRGYAYDTDRIR